MTSNLLQNGMLDQSAAGLIRAACSGTRLAAVPKEIRDTVRASIYKKYALNHQNPIRRDGYAVSSLRKEDCYHSY